MQKFPVNQNLPELGSNDFTVLIFLEDKKTTCKSLSLNMEIS